MSPDDRVHRARDCDVLHRSSPRSYELPIRGTMLSDEDLEAQERSLRAEADALLRRYGVLGTLRRFGTPHIIGSYAMRLMTWRDLDIYLEMPSCETTSFLELGCEVGK